MIKINKYWKSFAVYIITFILLYLLLTPDKDISALIFIPLFSAFLFWLLDNRKK